MASTCLLDITVIIDAINNRNGRSQLLEGLRGRDTAGLLCDQRDGGSYGNAP